MVEINRKTVAEEVTDVLRTRILSGALPVGSVLRQEELAKEIGVSRTPLREAITRLELEGLVANDAYRGAVVRVPTQSELEEAYLIREALEGLASRLAAKRRRPADVERVRAILDSFERVDDVDEWARLNTRFHMEIYAIHGRQQLYEMISTVRNRTELFVRMLVAEPRRAADAHEDHERILEALDRGDPDELEAETIRHLRTTVKQVREELPSASCVEPAPQNKE